MPLQGPATSPASSTIERSYDAGAGTPLRRTQSRTESNGREVIKETTEVPGPDGKLKTSLETTTETVRTGPDSTQIKREVFAPDAQGRSRLVEISQTEVQKSAGGSSRSITNTMAPDVNGRLVLAGREVEETKSVSPTVKETYKTIYRPGVNEAITESERLQQTERTVTKDVTQNETKRSERDANGRWQTTETRNAEVRVTGSERVAEETVQRLNDNGALALTERKVTKQSNANGRDETVTETYLAPAQGRGSSDGRLELDQRVRQTTASSPGGEQQTIREVEGRSPGSPNEPWRVVERTVETLRQIAPGRFEVQRQVFVLDANGRFVPVLTEKGEAAER
jgi:hypothetical protein